MTAADITLAVFTLFNSLRFLAYVPQIATAVRDTTGARAISSGTWALFLASHASAMAYAIENLGDWKMASMFLVNAVGCAAILLIAAWKRFSFAGAAARSAKAPAPTEARVDIDRTAMFPAETRRQPATKSPQSIMRLGSNNRRTTAWR
jgi:hypothetical protein